MAVALHRPHAHASVSRDIIPPYHWRMTFQVPRRYICRPLQLILPRGQSSGHYCDLSDIRTSRFCSSSYAAGADSVWYSRACRAEVPTLPTCKLKRDWKALAALEVGFLSWELQRPRAGVSRKSNAERGASPGRVECSSSGIESSWVVGAQEWRRAVVNCLTASSHCQITHTYQDFGAMGLVLGGALLWVKVFGYLAKQDLVERKLSRKLVHISSGLLYLACWPLFSFSPWARFVAALVPLVNIVRFLIAGLGLRDSEALVRSMSREGDPKELLRGPFYYVIVLMLSAVFFWRDSPVGMISLAMMCGGDGVADIVGRKYGTLKLPYNADKSWVGSVAMCIFGFLVALGFLQYFSALGFFELDVIQAVPRVALIALAATVVESLPLTSRYDDNITVPLTTVLLGVVLFP